MIGRFDVAWLLEKALELGLRALTRVRYRKSKAPDRVQLTVTGTEQVPRAERMW